MKTRIIVDQLIGENTPTYFLDYFDEDRMEWKNHTNHKTLHEAMQEQTKLVESNGI